MDYYFVTVSAPGGAIGLVMREEDWFRVRQAWTDQLAGKRQEGQLLHLSGTLNDAARTYSFASVLPQDITGLEATWFYHEE